MIATRWWDEARAVGAWRAGFAVTAVALAGGLAWWAASSTAGPGRAGVELVDGLGIAVLIASLVAGRAWPFPWAVVLLGAGAAYPIANAHTSDVAAIAYGGGLWLVAELAYGSLDRRVTLPGVLGTELRYAGRLVVAAAGSLALDVVALATSGHQAQRAMTMALGVTSVVAVVALAALVRPEKGE